MSALELPVRVRVVGRGADVGHSRVANEVLEVLGDELRTVVGDEARRRVGHLFAGALEHRLDIGGGHPIAQLPVHQEPGGPVEDLGEIVEGPRNVDVTHIDVSMLVGRERLDESRALAGWCPVPAIEHARGVQHAVDRRGAHRHAFASSITDSTTIAGPPYEPLRQEHRRAGVHARH